MARINVLDFEVANLIAAGEVVDRPASVLKELLENAIDAGATKINALVRNGGVVLIRVTDNGCGMDAEDLPVAIKRHATSKIKDKVDLDGIITLGFRGEALAATAAVSRLTVISKTADSDSGSMIVSEGGKITEASEIGCANGTTVAVENLFYNVPARKKFLKKDSTEMMACLAVAEKVAISKPNVAFEFKADNTVKFSTSGDGSLLNALYAVYGRDFASKLIPVSGEISGISVSGFVGRSDNVRSNRNMQDVFINERYVKSKTVMAALEQAYTSFIAPGKFPVATLFVTINPALVDVNVHPSKLEVKFSDERKIFEVVYYSVKGALEKSELRPEIHFEQKKPSVLQTFVPIKSENTEKRSEQIKITPSELTPKQSFEVLNTYNRIIREDKPDAGTVYLDELPLPEKKQPSIPQNNGIVRTHAEYKTDERSVQAEYISEPQREEKEELHDYKYVGEAFNCYLIVEYEGELLLIDKHAAHERINFEKMKKMLEEDGRVASQELAIPVEAKLSAAELSAAQESREEIESVGFSFEIEGDTALVSAIPENLPLDKTADTFIEISNGIANGTATAKLSEIQRREKALYQIACKASIKGGRVYDSVHINWLINKVISMPDIKVCPHGRPIAFTLTKNELDRQFNRIK